MHTAMDELLPRCDAVLETIKEQKTRQGLTNQQLADVTGIPLSNVKKYFSGDLKNPSLFYTAAACRVLGLSLDEMLGLEARPGPEQDSRGHKVTRILAVAALVISVAALGLALVAVL